MMVFRFCVLLHGTSRAHVTSNQNGLSWKTYRLCHNLEGLVQFKTHAIALHYQLRALVG